MSVDDFSPADASQWIGCVQSGVDTVTPELVRRYNAIFAAGENVGIGDVAPPTIHWCLARPSVHPDLIGEDGHPVRGLFLPPIPLKRRMWAGSTLEFIRPLRVGDEVRCVSRLTDIRFKTGNSGRLAFVTFAHEVLDGQGVALTEVQDIVYLDPPPARNADRSAAEISAPAFTRSVRRRSDPVMLFRYSAITFNGHRIHYDHPYATEVEGYPGLVVHGPMQALLLLDFARENGRPIRRFSFRGRSPLICGCEFTLAAGEDGPDKTELAVFDENGVMTMSAWAAH